MVEVSVAEMETEAATMVLVVQINHLVIIMVRIMLLVIQESIITKHHLNQRLKMDSESLLATKLDKVTKDHQVQQGIKI
jgi:hypothetical protein